MGMLANTGDPSDGCFAWNDSLTANANLPVPIITEPLAHHDGVC